MRRVLALRVKLITALQRMRIVPKHNHPTTNAHSLHDCDATPYVLGDLYGRSRELSLAVPLGLCLNATLDTFLSSEYLQKPTTFSLTRFADVYL